MGLCGEILKDPLFKEAISMRNYPGHQATCSLRIRCLIPDITIIRLIWVEGFLPTSCGFMAATVNNRTISEALALSAARAKVAPLSRPGSHPNAPQQYQLRSSPTYPNTTQR